MSAEENKAIARRYFEDLLNNGNVAAVDELFAANSTLYYPLIPEAIRGTEPLKQFFARQASE